jgi:hypothetical protein
MPNARKRPIPTIEEIRAYRYAGNHYADGAKFDAIHDFVVAESTPMAHKQEALLRMERDGMGFPTSSVSEQDVLDYILDKD